VRKQRERGFTLIELLMVVAIIGVLAGIAIPNLLIAIQRSKQRRTMADMRSIATAWEARFVDESRYNAAGAALPSVPVDVNALAPLLEPTYIKTMPRLDGWGKPLSFYMDQPLGGEGAGSYTIVSSGRDEQFADPEVLGPFTNYDCDIVYSNGMFLSYPDGLGQSN
jgi:type II secretion system protein G